MAGSFGRMQVKRILIAALATLDIRIRSLWLPLILVLGVWAPPACAQGAVNVLGDGGEAGAGPVFPNPAPDAATYGAAAGYPLGTRATASELGNLIGTYS